MPRLPLALLATVDPVLRDTVALTATLEPGTVVVRHDLLADRGGIRRVVSDLAGVVEDVVVPLDHACVSCAVREDAIPTLRRLAADGRWGQAVLALPVSGESLPVARTLAPQTEPGGDLPEYRLSAVVCAADLTTFVEDVLGDDLLAERGRALTEDDRRAVGEALVGLVEHADVVVTSGDAHAGSSELLELLRAADGERVDGVHLLDGAALFAGTHDPEAGEARTDLDRDPGERAEGLAGDGFRTLRLSAEVPFHPDRLLDRVEELGSGRIRSRGVFWVPTRPDSVIGWEGSGGQLSVGELGEWGDDEPRVDLTFTGLAADLAHLPAVFEAVLLTDEEHAAGLEAWLGRQDVLEPWLGERSFG